jgi:hypothetical protein
MAVNHILIASDILSTMAYFVIAYYTYYYWAKKRQYIQHHFTLLAISTTFAVRGLIIISRTFENQTVYLYLAPLAAIISSYGAWAVSRFIVYFLRFKLPREYEAEIASMKAMLEAERKIFKEAEHEVQKINHALANQIQGLQNQLHVQGWILEKQVDLDKMRAIITDLRKTYAGTDKATP